MVRGLVLGQYVRVGGSARFGFGHYRIEELGPCRYACKRFEGLTELALLESSLDRLADEMEIPSGLVRQAVSEIRQGTYQPDPHYRVPYFQVVFTLPDKLSSLILGNRNKLVLPGI